jgi:membrane protease YdiL (CAAX protease family)
MDLFRSLIYPLLDDKGFFAFREKTAVFAKGLDNKGMSMQENSQGLVFFLLLWTFAAQWFAMRLGFYEALPQERLHKPPLFFRDVLGAFAIFLLVQTALIPFGALIFHYFQTGSWEMSPSFGQGWIQLVAIIFSTACLILYILLGSRTRALLSAGGLQKFKKDVFLGSVSWLICFPLVSLLSLLVVSLLEYFHLNVEAEQVAVEFLKQALSDRLLFWVSFWLIIFVVPFTEEVIFRGFLQGWLRQKMNPRLAIAATSLVFAFFHFSSSQGWHNVDLVCALFILSCCLGFLYEKTGSIWAPAALHMTFNAVSEVAIVGQEGGFSL